jgi:glycine oxidase
MLQPDVLITGAGIVGLSCALELSSQGMRVTLLEKGAAGQQASWAAAGMLAARDPENPPALQPLSEFSIALYPDFLTRIESLSGVPVPLETGTVYESGGAPILRFHETGLRDGQSTLLARNGLIARPEHSLDPRRLAAALLLAVRASGVDLREGVEVQQAATSEVRTSAGSITFGTFIDCRGAWAGVTVVPRKGQMLRVHAPGVLPGVVRTPQIYMVPRLDGSVVIGATVEDAGFDKAVHAADLAELRARAAALIPQLTDAPELESWAGLRPDTPDHLPLIGRTGHNRFIAAGHFRNGILLAPGTARVMLQLVQGQQPEVDLTAFSPDRFHRQP